MDWINVAYDRYVLVAIFWECNGEFSCFTKFAEYLDWARRTISFPVSILEQEIRCF